MNVRCYRTNCASNEVKFRELRGGPAIPMCKRHETFEVALRDLRDAIEDVWIAIRREVSEKFR